MITTKTRHGVEYQFDTDTQLFLSPESGKPIKNPRPRRETAKKVESTSFYLKWDEIEKYVDNLQVSPCQRERHYVMLTKFYFLNSHFDSERVCYYDSIDLRNIGGSKYPEILERLVSDEVLDRIQIGINPYNSMPMYAYVVKPAYLPTGSRRRVKVEFKATDTGLQKFRQRRRQNLRDSQSFSMYERMKHYEFDLRRLTHETFHNITATKYIQYQHNRKIRNEYDGKSKTILSFELYAKQFEAFYELMLMWNEMHVDDRIEFFSKDHFGNRFHSIFSRLPAEFREFVCVSGNPFNRCIDLRASQPTLAADIIRNHVGECDYVRDVESGEFYERMMQRLDIESKAACKTIFMGMMFGRIEGKNHQRLEAIYPYAGAFIRSQKESASEMIYYRDGKQVTKRIKANAVWARKLQQRESKIMRLIWTALDAMNIHYLPVHDAVYVTEDDYEDARAVFSSLVGQELSVEFNLSE
jgi:hypothetical protein